MATETWPKLASSFPFRLSLVAEETGHDLESTLRFARQLGISEIDLGTLWGERIDRVPQATLLRAKDLLDRYEIKVRVVAPETFKTVLLRDVPLGHIAEEPHFQEHLALLRAQLAVARFLEATFARVYSFRREGMAGLGNPSPRSPQGGTFPEEMQERVAFGLALACREAERAQIPLALENVRSCWGNSGHNTGLVLRRVNSPWLTCIWDPANGYVSGEEDACSEGYQAVKPFVSHVHLKDAVVLDERTGLTQWERIGDGDVGLDLQLAALADDGYEGCVSIETHWSPPGSNPISNTRSTYAGLMRLLESLISRRRVERA